MAENVAYRSIVVAGQHVFWLVAQLLRVRYSVTISGPTEIFESRKHCWILAPAHKSFFDPWLLMIGLRYRHFRAVAPVRILATQDPRGILRSFMPLIRILFWLGGAIVLPPEDRDDRSLPEKLRSLLVALKHGDVVMIFPEGEIHRKSNPPVGKFAPGVVYVSRRLEAPVVPIAVWMSQGSSLRHRYVVQFGRPVRIPEKLDQDAAAAWLRQRVLALYEEIKQREEQ